MAEASLPAYGLRGLSVLNSSTCFTAWARASQRSVRFSSWLVKDVETSLELGTLVLKTSGGIVDPLKHFRDSTKVFHVQPGLWMVRKVMLSMAQRSCRHPPLIAENSHNLVTTSYSWYLYRLVLSEWKPKNSCTPKPINHAVMLSCCWAGSDGLSASKRTRCFAMSKSSATQSLWSFSTCCFWRRTESSLPAFRARDTLCYKQQILHNFPTESLRHPVCKHFGRKSL